MRAPHSAQIGAGPLSSFFAMSQPRGRDRSRALLPRVNRAACHCFLIGKSGALRPGREIAVKNASRPVRQSYSSSPFGKGSWVFRPAKVSTGGACFRASRASAIAVCACLM